jgi:flagellar hook-basal body complex protein FliE
MVIKPLNLPLAELANASIGKTPAVGSVGGAGPIGPTGISPVGGEGAGSDFSATLREALNEANANQARAETASHDYATGKQNDLHGTMITMTEADISLRLVANVRNRVIEAYREVMRMGS